MQPHASAAVFFVALLAFELAYWWRLRRVAPRPWVPVLVRAGLLAVYVGSTSVDVLTGLTTNVALGVGVGAVLAVGAALVFRPAWRATPAGILALSSATVEELIFRGAFLFPAMVSPLGTVLGVVGSTLTNVIWRVPAERARGITLWRVLLFSFAFLAAYGVLTALTRSLWPALLVHAVTELSRAHRYEERLAA